jgi:hypothetical protein
VKTLEIEQMWSRWWRCRPVWISVIGPAHRNRDMLAIWQTDNEIRVNTAANPDALDLLSAERMIWVGYGYESRRGLGRSGGLL